MSWFRLDDSGWCHAKVLLVGNRAFGAWCRAGQWASQQLSDGFVPASVCRLIEPASAVWRALSDAGMMHPCDGGWTIHDYLEYNPSREQVQAKQAAQREGGKVGAHARWSRLTDGSTHGSTQDEPMTNRMARARVSSHPIPSHPEDPPVVPQGGRVQEGEFGLSPDPDPEAPKGKKGNGKTTEARTVFEHWREAMMPKAIETPKRLARITARLKEGFTVAQLCQAIDGALLDDWIMGRDVKARPGGWRDLETVLRDAAQIERLIALPNQPKPTLSRARGGPPQQEAMTWEPGIQF